MAAVLILAYTASAVASDAPLLPAGIGVVETVTSALLKVYGVPLADALAAVLVYRVIGTLLPALAGLVGLATLHLETPPEPEEQDMTEGDRGDSNPRLPGPQPGALTN